MTTPDKTLKQRMRLEAKRRRAEFDPAWRASASETIARRALELPAVRMAREVALFASFGDEVGTHDLIRELIHTKGNIVLPRVLQAERRLAMHRVDAFPDGFAPSAYGVSEPDPRRHPTLIEPEQLDLIFVPALLFDRAGYRIGYGGGYYDRLLNCLTEKTMAIGLAFGMQVVNSLPRDPWDHPVHAILTEADWIEIK